MYRLLVIGVALTAVLFSGVDVFAEYNNVELEKIVVTPLRDEGELSKIPANVTIITSDDIKQSNAKTIPEVLKTQIGISMRDYTGTGKSVSADMRGFGESGSSNMLVLIDGRRATAIDLSGTDWSQIPLSEVQRIEIVRGAASVVYGDNAVGGVVNILTKKGSGKPTVKLEQKGGSYNTSSTNVELSGSKNKFSYYANGTYYDTRGYRDNSDFRSKDFGGNIGYKFNENLNYAFSFGYHKDNTRLPGALKESELKYGRRYTTKPNDKSDAKDYFGNWLISGEFGKQKLQANISIQNRDSNMDYASSSWKTENHIVTFGFSPKYTLNADLFDFANKLILGFDYNKASDSILDGAYTGANDLMHIKKKTFGGYLLEQLSLRDDLIVSAGYRRQSADYKFSQITQVATSAKSYLRDDAYSLGANYIYKPESSLFANFSTSFRYPLVDEYFSSNTWGTGGLNAALSTQTAVNYELGMKHKFNDKADMDMSLFRSNYKNEIYFDPLTYANSNYDKTIHQGVELGARYSFLKRIKGLFNYSFTEAIFKGGAYAKNQIPMVPRHKLAIGFNIDLGKGFRFDLLENFVGSRRFISDQGHNYSPMKKYSTLDLKLSYDFNNFNIFFGINNVSNVKYSEYGVISIFSSEKAYYPSPERNFVAGGKVSF